MMVLFSSESLYSLDTFCASYEDLFFRLFDDSGLGEAEDIIKKLYQDTANKMNDDILELVDDVLSNDTILGVSQLDDVFTVTKSYARYRLWISYKENLQKDTRIVTNIIIYRK